MIRNLIFDWSGTLVDDLPAVWEASNRVFVRAGVPALTLEEFRAEFCLPFKPFYDRYVPRVALAELEEWFHAYFREIQHTARELPHARAFLEFCRKHQIRSFLLSTLRPDHFQVQCRENGFNHFFEETYLGVLDKRVKIAELLQTHRLKPEETLFVGDMQHDIDTARHGGIHSCAVLTGYNRLAQLRQSEPDMIVENLGELRQFLDEHQFRWVTDPADSATPKRVFPIATVGALIGNSAGQVLMVRTQKWSDLWGIPGGKIKWGEPSLDALRREIMEETGLEIERIRFVMVQDCIGSREFYREAHFVLLNYTAMARDGQRVVLNDEAREFRWLAPGEAAQLPLNQPTRTLLETVLAAKDTPWIK
jgi:phosphoglycolate phosphatase